MAFSEQYLEELAARNDIVDVVSQYVRLSKKSGANQFGICPFHSEKTPSFSVNPEKQIYKCFGCGKGGGVINFIMEAERLDFRDAVIFLAERAHMPLPEEDESGQEERSRRKVLLELNREAARFFHQQLCAPTGKAGQDYVLRRGISPALVKRFGLGYAPDSWDSLRSAMHTRGYSDRDLLEAGLIKPGRRGGGYDTFRSRLMFPVIDVRGNVIGFSGRIIGDGEPKYLNSPETPVFSKSHNLFALNLAKKSKSGYIILTEGNIDVVALHQAGFDSAVASLGTSFTEEQARLIAKYAGEVVLCYDSDAAGKKAAERAIHILQRLEMKVRVLEMKDAKDPDEYIEKFGADAFRNLLEGSSNQVEYRLRRIEEAARPDSTEGKVSYLRGAAELLAGLPGAVEREVYAASVAEKAGVSRDAVLAEIKRIRNARKKAAGKKEQRELARPTQTVQPSSRQLRYEDPGSAVAEEGLIRLLYLEPELARQKELPAPEDFSSPVLGRFYKELLLRARDNAPISMAVLASEFGSDEMGLFTDIISGQADLSNSDRALQDYIKTIVSRQRRQDMDLRQYAEEMKKTKSYGG